MLLFKEEEIDDIRSGKITITFRDWDKLRVEPGKEYKSFNLGFVRVEEVGYVDFKKIPEEDLAEAGFDSHEEFKAIFRKRNPGFNFGSGKLIRIKFTYLGSEQRDASGVRPSEREVMRIMEKLVEIDILSNSELKSEDILGFLSEETPMNSTKIAKEFDAERDEIRTRMNQLKNEGLVASKRTGFVLTVRGKTYLDSKI